MVASRMKTFVITPKEQLPTRRLSFSKNAPWGEMTISALRRGEATFWGGNHLPVGDQQFFFPFYC